jgi:hypothetical protein
MKREEHMQRHAGTHIQRHMEQMENERAYKQQSQQESVKQRVWGQSEN